MGTSSGLRVLVVDDDRDSVQLIQRMLEITGHEVDAVFDSVETVETVRFFKPHVVILDLMMPGQDGFKTARLLRRESGLPRPHIVAISGHDDDATIARALAAGADRFIPKPVKLADICNIANSAVSQ